MTETEIEKTKRQMLEDDLSEKIDRVKLDTHLKLIRDSFKYKEVNISNLSNLILKVVLVVEKFKRLNDLEKKNTIVVIVNMLIEDLCPGEDTTLEEVLKLMVPDLVENIVDYGNFRNIYKCFRCV